MVDDKITLSINADELLRDLEEVETKAEAVENKVVEVKQKADISFGKIVGGLSAAWLTTQGLVRAAGGSIQTVFRSVIGSTIGAIAMLAPIVATQATTGDYIRAAMGMASIALATSALVAAELQEKEISDALRGANMAIHGVQSLVNIFY